MAHRYAVIGNPIGHTRSPVIQSAFARQTGQDIVYDAIEAPLDGFATAVGDFRARGGRGLNVTLPFKVEAFSLATDLMDRARLAGAVNVMRFDDDGVLADNVDGVGLMRDIQENLGFPIRGRRVLLMGAGGAARGAVLPLLEQRPASLVIANRTVAKARALGDQFSAYGDLETGGYAEVADRPFDVIINATSASLRGEMPPVTGAVFSDGCLAYDLVYGKGLTPFLRLARDAGARIADGIGMLVEQAAESFFLWRGVRPQTRPMIDGLSVPLT